MKFFNDKLKKKKTKMVFNKFIPFFNSEKQSIDLALKSASTASNTEAKIDPTTDLAIVLSGVITAVLCIVVAVFIVAHYILKKRALKVRVST